jgi:drug/metabolite transporter (DMT)-like permease
MWGSSFPISKDLLTHLPVSDYLAVRFAIATLALWAVRPRVLLSLSRRQVAVGVVLGLIYGAGQFLQFEGLSRAAVTVSAFLVSMYVVVVPIFGAAVHRTKVPRATWIAVGLAVAGVMTMSLRGWSFGLGESLVLSASLFYAAHILVTGRLVRTGEAHAVTLVQMATIAVACGIAGVHDGITLPQGADWWPMLYLALGCGALAMLVQAWSQARITVSQASVVMVTEPVWASMFAVVIWSEALDLRTVLGAGLVLGAAFLVLTDRGHAVPVVDPLPVQPSPTDLSTHEE